MKYQKMVETVLVNYFKLHLTETSMRKRFILYLYFCQTTMWKAEQVLFVVKLKYVVVYTAVWLLRLSWMFFSSLLRTKCLKLILNVIELLWLDTSNYHHVNLWKELILILDFKVLVKNAEVWNVLNVTLKFYTLTFS